MTDSINEYCFWGILHYIPWSTPYPLTLFLDEASLEHRMKQSSGEKLPWKLSRLRKWQSSRGIAHLGLKIENTAKNFRGRTLKI